MPSSSAIVNVGRVNGVERERITLTFRPNGAAQPIVTYGPGGVLVPGTALAAPTAIGVSKEGTTGKFFVNIAAGIVTAQIASGLGAGVQGASNAGTSRLLIGAGAELRIIGPSGSRAHVGNFAFNSDGSAVFEVWTVDVAGAGIDLPSLSTTWVTFWMEIEERA